MCLVLILASHRSKIQQSLLHLLLSRFCKTETCRVLSSFDTESTLWHSPSGSVLQMKNGIQHKPEFDHVILHCFPITALSRRQLGLLMLNSGAALLQPGSAVQCLPTAKNISASARGTADSCECVPWLRHMANAAGCGTATFIQGDAVRAQLSQTWWNI